jgi:hypothetical protein
MLLLTKLTEDLVGHSCWINPRSLCHNEPLLSDKIKLHLPR